MKNPSRALKWCPWGLISPRDSPRHLDIDEQAVGDLHAGPEGGKDPGRPFFELLVTRKPSEARNVERRHGIARGEGAVIRVAAAGHKRLVPLPGKGERTPFVAEEIDHGPVHLHGGGKPAKTNLVLALPDGTVREAATDLSFPNGTVITPDGGTLIIGESFGACLTAFDVAEDGALSNRRVWAQLEGAVPDGICLDAEGAIWVASPVSGEVLRVREGGEIVERIAVEHEAFACMLGGEEGRTLFVCTAESSDPQECLARRSGRIEAFEVEVPRAGLP